MQEAVCHAGSPTVPPSSGPSLRGCHTFLHDTTPWRPKADRGCRLPTIATSRHHGRDQGSHHADHMADKSPIRHPHRIQHQRPGSRAIRAPGGPVPLLGVTNYRRHHGGCGVDSVPGDIAFFRPCTGDIPTLMVLTHPGGTLIASIPPVRRTTGASQDTSDRNKTPVREYVPQVEDISPPSPPSPHQPLSSGTSLHPPARDTLDEFIWNGDRLSGNTGLTRLCG